MLDVESRPNLCLARRSDRHRDVRVAVRRRQLVANSNHDWACQSDDPSTKDYGDVYEPGLSARLQQLLRGGLTRPGLGPAPIYSPTTWITRPR